MNHLYAYSPYAVTVVSNIIKLNTARSDKNRLKLLKEEKQIITHCLPVRLLLNKQSEETYVASSCIANREI